MSDPTPGYELLASELVKREARIERLEALLREMAAEDPYTPVGAFHNDIEEALAGKEG